MRRRRARGRAAGQSLAELALVLPVLLLIVLVAMSRRVFYGYVTLTNATRIGANYAAAHPAAWGRLAMRRTSRIPATRPPDMDGANCDLIAGAEPVLTPTFADSPPIRTRLTRRPTSAPRGSRLLHLPTHDADRQPSSATIVPSVNADFAVRAGRSRRPVQPAPRLGRRPRQHRRQGPRRRGRRHAVPTPTIARSSRSRTSRA
jgi:hypothetical protein